MSKTHNYSLTVKWTGNRGQGTTNATKYDRSHIISIIGKPDLQGSSDTAFRGDATRHNPEDMLLSAISACHMLWYLHLCADAGVIVTEYIDNATGTMQESSGGGGHFTNVTLHPVVTVTDSSMIDKANELHSSANKKCFISNSVNFPVMHKPVCVTG